MMYEMWRKPELALLSIEGIFNPPQDVWMTGFGGAVSYTQQLTVMAVTGLVVRSPWSSTRHFN